MLTPGTRVGGYEVLGSLGAGGMGEVYRARDTRLHRDVALKVLPDLVALDPDRLARLDREAQLLAALNHPNIAVIYGFEQVGAVRALALELVDGDTLADRIAAGPIPIDEALPLALQIIAALEAAHDAGIVHRDLKPANIKVRPDATVKVLDFGLAKTVGATGSSVSATMSPTLTSPAMTGAGVILGTAAYMAPEQARGRTVDKRADIWAFGCVLFEMLSGRRAFGGSDVTDVLASVIKSDPDWRALPADVPAYVRVALRECLEKDAAQRFRDIGDVRLALSGAFHTESPLAGSSARPTRGRTAATVAAVALLAAATGGIVWWVMRPAPAALVRLTIAHTGPERLGAGGPDIDVSPDGRVVTYAAADGSRGGRGRIFARPLDQLTPTPLAVEADNATNVSVSPDGQWVAYVERGDSELSIRRVPIGGGAPQTLAHVSTAVGVNGIAWGPGDGIVFGTTNAGLMRVATAGATPEPLTTPDAQNGERSHRQPTILPGGNGVLFTVMPADGLVENFRIGAADLTTGAHTVIIQSGSHPRYVPTGHLVYAGDGVIRAVRFDPARRQPHGIPVVVVEGVVTKTGGVGSFAVSASGLLAYIAGVSEQPPRVIVWVDRTGREEPISAPPRRYAYARLSPDGARLALDVRQDTNDIWMWDLERRTLTRLTFEPGLNRGPIWTPDGRRVVFSAERDNVETLYWQAADGSGAAERLLTSDEQRLPASVSADGKWLFFNQPGGAPYDFGVLPLDGSREPRMLLRDRFSEHNPVLSPDGRWLAYESDESGRYEIYVRPFPDIDSGRTQVSTDGGTRPLWSRDGGELFYLVPPGAVMSAPVTPGPTFSVGAPALVFKGDYVAPQTGRAYDVSPDGRRFLMLKNAPAETAEPPRQLVVVQNWAEELERLVPAE